MHVCEVKWTQLNRIGEFFLVMLSKIICLLSSLSIVTMPVLVFSLYVYCDMRINNKKPFELNLKNTEYFFKIREMLLKLKTECAGMTTPALFCSQLFQSLTGFAIGPIKRSKNPEGLETGTF